ncbi:hypothetical protein PLIIFM63780_009049 [Purpureocillium lilacinum]|uniref:uncharacterized protein n=1 Tax=Purpureocillium lilacinum TaxID=33203 RepID=UPI00208D1E83|nr:hypothetical protein PLICBS_009841 [Purpureocillium lilacinum]GJN85482.1 hypothetical protein PLIIFM63780_009049 [Purpureocillium lilacinum]
MVNLGTSNAAAPAAAPKFEHVTWYKEPHLRRLYFLSFFLLIGSATTGFDGMLQNTSQQMDYWKSYFPEYNDPNKLGILINMYNIGSIIAYFISPYIVDTSGRRPAIMAGCFFMIAGACLTASAQNFGIVSLVGWGVASIPSNWSWRSITFMQCLPSVIQITGIWWVPESPRLLVHRDRSEEALAMLVKHHGGGDPNNATVLFEYREMKQAIEEARTSKGSASYFDFLKTKGNRWRLAIVISSGVISQYSGNALFSNYIDVIYDGAGITEQNKKLALSAGKTIMDTIISITAALYVDRIGRRPLFLTGIFGMVVAFACWTVCGAIYEESGVEGSDGTMTYNNTASGYAQVAFIWLFGAFYDIGFGGLLVSYSLEIVPFHLRAKGLVILNLTIQIVLAIGNQTNKVAWENLPHHWNFMLFYTIWDFCELIFVYFFYIETKGPTLEEIARIFDGDSAPAPVTQEETEKEAALHVDVAPEKMI